ncbi:MAG: hypothetical protein PHI28_12865 [Mangrovibacterium sp.]|nr:hypothetical protein [Mangrovibacterium sp.]
MILETMNTAQIKQELHKYIDNGDDRFLRLIHSVATNYSSDEDYTVPGPPMNIDTYRKRIQNAKERVKAGYCTTQENLEKEMEQW